MTKASKSTKKVEETKEIKLGKAKASRPPKAPPKVERSVSTTLADKIMKRIDLNKVKGEEAISKTIVPAVAPKAAPKVNVAAAQAESSGIVFANDGKLDFGASLAARTMSAPIIPGREDLKALLLKGK